MPADDQASVVDCPHPLRRAIHTPTLAPRLPGKEEQMEDTPASCVEEGITLSQCFTAGEPGSAEIDEVLQDR